MTEGSGSRLTGRGQRLALRPLEEGDREAMMSWLKEMPVNVDDGLLAITSRDGDSIYGVLAYRLGYPEEGWLSVEAVAVEPGLSGQGYDAEAVRLLEGEALERGLASRFWAPVRHDDGLGLYFWLRLGYRPALPGENPWLGERPRDIIAMIRVATT
ncbi:MAG: GNAT family N-acetyltransferase [Chloroflexi bacterium]|nr:GNAT family N-acetyltransferase [Chloroflexota bacterium]